MGDQIRKRYNMFKATYMGYAHLFLGMSVSKLRTYNDQ